MCVCVCVCIAMFLVIFLEDVVAVVFVDGGDNNVDS